MSWKKEELFIKAKLFLNKAFEEERDNPLFGLWSAMGLELLCRSALAHISPMLLAEPDPQHSNLLHALGKGSEKSNKKSLVTSQVLNLNQLLIPDFKSEDFKLASYLINLRNEELHTGTPAFANFPSQDWLGGFYKLCKTLAEFQEETLESLLGEDLKKEAETILSEMHEEVLSKTKSAIAAHKRVFDSKPVNTQKKLKEEAEKSASALTSKGYHRVKCPSCSSIATVTGEPSGLIKIEHVDGGILEKQTMLPNKFNCSSCELKIDSYSALKAANLAGHYTRKRLYSPEDYYNMINKSTYESVLGQLEELQNEYDYDEPDFFEFNND
ncbi:hypothetical protein MUK51_07205 [Sphingobacterium faecium]|uniref:hypothetical protein n=1 Tax=Sphingobacterium faecium TaxID=34087 RepID=UPI0021B53145|nr:hypothetical protein [Sphingobacterium faecium]UXD71073.1 hypothetical protein MUK51_07205 [Sphingobacterium faecium]